MTARTIQTFSLEQKRLAWSGIGARSTAAADPDMQPHRHSFFQVFFVARGEAQHAIGDRVLEAGDGSIFFIKPYTIHRVRFPRDAECYVLDFSAGFLEGGRGDSDAAALQEAALRRPEMLPFVFQHGCTYRLDPQQVAQARLRCLHIEQCCGRRDPFDLAEARAELVLLLTMVARTHARTFEALDAGGHAERRIDRRAQAALDYIRRHFARPLTLAEVADHVHLTGTYLTHLLRQEVGRPFKQILDEARLENSKNLLAYTDAQMQKIAQESGFLDQAHFARRFKAATRLTPGQFRRQHQGQALQQPQAKAGNAKSTAAGAMHAGGVLPTMDAPGSETT